MSAPKLLALLPVLAVFLVWFVLFRPAQLGGGTSYIIVSGVSMEPTLYTNDFAIMRKQDRYQTGDVVAFRTDRGTGIHRIIGGNASDGFDLQGDNNGFVDPWHPKPEHIIGAYWFHVPGAGRWLTPFMQPLNFALAVGVLGSISIIGAGKVHRHRRRGRLRTMDSQRSTPQGVPPVLLGGLVVAGLLAVLLAIAALMAWTAKPERTTMAERLRYDHTADFTYSADVNRSSLYPSGMVGPVSTSTLGEGESPPPLYWALDPRMHLSLDYELSSPFIEDGANLAGEISAVVLVQAGEQGWRRTLEALAPVPFTGHSTAVDLPIDLAGIRALILSIEEETGFSPSSYQATVLATITIAGTIGSEPIDIVYNAPFRMTITRTQVSPAAALSTNGGQSRMEQGIEPGSVSFLGLTMGVSRARWVTTSALGLELAAAGALAAVVFLGLGRGEQGRIRARYGSSIVSVAETRLDADPSKQVRLASIHDLVRLARRDSRMILHHQRGSEDTYFVQDGDLTYLYTSATRPSGASAERQEA